MSITTTELPKGGLKDLCEELGVQQISFFPSPDSPVPTSSEEFIEALKKEAEKNSTVLF